MFNIATLVGSNPSIVTRYLFNEKLPIQQFTGLTSKSGVEIYEGDIVDIEGEICQVKFTPPSFAAYNAQKHEWNL